MVFRKTYFQSSSSPVTVLGYMGIILTLKIKPPERNRNCKCPAFLRFFKGRGGSRVWEGRSNTNYNAFYLVLQCVKVPSAWKKQWLLWSSQHSYEGASIAVLTLEKRNLSTEGLIHLFKVTQSLIWVSLLWAKSRDPALCCYWVLSYPSLTYRPAEASGFS